MSVIQLVKDSGRETAQLHEALADLASRGEVVGSATMYRMADGTEQSAFSGVYKSSAAHAVNAAMRVGWKLTQLQDAILGPP